MKNLADAHSLMLLDFKKQWVKKSASDYAKTLLATAIGAAPSIPLSTLSNILPLLVGAFLIDTGFLEHRQFKLKNFCKSFPSDNYMREVMFEKAAECTLSLAALLKGKHVGLGSDKGNSLGCEHLAKMLSVWCDVLGCVLTFLLDLNGTGNSGEDICDAIVASLKNVRCPEDFLLTTLATNSGGAGTTEEAADKLEARRVTIIDALVSACTLHCYQLHLSIGVNMQMGAGSLKKKNMMQMLHCAYDIQKNLSSAEFQEYIKIASDWVTAQLGEDAVLEEGHFQPKFNKIKAWCNWKPLTNSPSLWPQDRG